MKDGKKSGIPNIKILKIIWNSKFLYVGGAQFFWNSPLSLSWTPEHNPPNQCDADEYQVSYQPYDLRSCSTTTEEPGTLPWQSTATATVTNLSSNTYYRITLSSRNLPADGQAAVLGNSVNAVERKCREII